jgi:hypothetical protein
VKLKTPESDPINHERTSRRHAGEAFTHSAMPPGRPALFVGVFAFTTGHCFALPNSPQVRTAEVRWEAMNSEAARSRAGRPRAEPRRD